MEWGIDERVGWWARLSAAIRKLPHDGSTLANAGACTLMQCFKTTTLRARLPEPILSYTHTSSALFVDCSCVGRPLTARACRVRELNASIIAVTSQLHQQNRKLFWHCPSR